MKYLKNMWYVAAWDYEVTHALMAREILEKQILLYRKTDGQAVAISDVCPHRYAPLHKGQLLGNVVECPYHGLRFNSAGACVHNPHPHGNGPIPRNANLRSYPTLEKYGAIWIWMGEREPDESLVPDYQFISDKKNYRTITGVFDLENHCEMASDNALDLTHVTFTHAGMLGAGTDNVCDEQVVRERVGNTRWCKRFNNGIAAGSDFKRFNPALQSIAVDKQQNVRWNPPGYIVIIIRYVEADTTDKHLTSIFAGNLLTPISQTRARFFWSVSRIFGLDSDALARQRCARLRHARVGRAGVDGAGQADDRGSARLDAHHRPGLDAPGVHRRQRHPDHGAAPAQAAHRRRGKRWPIRSAAGDCGRVRRGIVP